MSQPYRLPSGGAIDRTRPLTFEWNGRTLSGFAGDTLASALLAYGHPLTSRSFKERRPRGVLAAGMEEAHALVETGDGARRTPSVRATLQPLHEGLVARSQHGWPSVDFDLGAVTELFRAFLPAGFYNKTFLWPRWEAYEPLIRRMAGLGRPPAAPDPDRYAWRNTHCDLLVVGGGVAGLAAALTAARGGARVLLAENDESLGGGLPWAAADRDGAIAGWIGAATAQLTELGELTGPTSSTRIRVLPRTTVMGAYDHGVFAAVERAAPTGVPSDAGAPHEPARAERWWRVRARFAIVATGAFEQPLVFPDNDRPGIVLAGAALAYLRRYAVLVGRTVLVATNNDSAYAAALALREAGAAIPAVVDTRPDVRADLRAALAAAGIPLLIGAHIDGARGRRRVSGAVVSDAGGVRRTIPCDAIAMSGGWNPAAHLHAQAGGRLRYDERQACLVPADPLPVLRVAGAAAGTFAPRAAAAEGAAAATAALVALDRPAPDDPGLLNGLPELAEPAAVGALGCAAARGRDRAWVDFLHDVSAADIDLAVRENLVSVEHLKRYTTVGMSPDQGKTSNLHALAILAERSGRTIAEVGTTKFRPPFVPVTLGTIAGGRTGAFLRPQRLLPSHDRQVAAGAAFEDYGLWRRPAFYPRPGESEGETIAREMRAVRETAGLFEASPLGKILVRGRDAADLLERVYANRVRDLAPGRVRYGLMLTEKGVVMDDGVCARLAPDELWVGSSSGNAGRVALWLEEWLQCQWPELDAVTTDVTSAWATMTVAGPRAREVLAALATDIDLSSAAFPHMHVRTGSLAGVPCRIFRVSFTGELSFEVNVPAAHGAALWDALLEAGAPCGLQPFGVEALLALRTEKGYLHVGADTDGTTVPDDIGFGAAIARKEEDFVGRRSLTLAENVRPDRLQLVGLRPVAGAAGSAAAAGTAFVAGAHLLTGERVTPPVATSGYLTSACFSPTLGHPVGLGMLARGRARLGETVTVVDGLRTCRAEVVSPVHYDPRGERLHG